MVFKGVDRDVALAVGTLVLLVCFQEMICLVLERDMSETNIAMEVLGAGRDMILYCFMRHMTVGTYDGPEGTFGVEVVIQLVLCATERTSILLMETDIVGPGVMGHEKKILFIGMVGRQSRTPDGGRACQTFPGIDPLGSFLIQLEINMGAHQTHTGDGIARGLTRFILAGETEEPHRHTDILLTDTTYDIHLFLVYGRKTGNHFSEE